MNFVYPDINFVFNTTEKGVHTLVIENQSMLQAVITDIYGQVQGNDGKSVVSVENKPLPFAKHCEILSQFIPFSLNKRSLVTKITQLLTARAVADEHFVETAELLAKVETIMYDLAFDLAFDLALDIEFHSITAEALIKATGVSLKEEYESLAEKVIDYMEMVNTLERRKLYILVNFRSYVSDEEMIYFIDTVLRRELNVLIIESTERSILKGELRYLVDESLCEIGS